MEVLNPQPENLTVNFDQGTVFPVPLSSGENEIPIFVKAESTTGSYDVKIKITIDNGDVIYSNIKIYVTEQGYERLPDLMVSNRDISFSNSNPNSGDPVTLIARIHNIGATAVSDVLVEFYDLDDYLGAATIENIDPGSIETAHISVSFTDEGVHLIRVVVDPYDQSDVIQELDETNNEASQILQVGSISESMGNIFVTASTPSTVTAGYLFKITGHSMYEIYVNEEWNRDYVVKGGAVQIIISNDTGDEWVYSDAHTDINGNFSKLVQAPSDTGSYHISIRVTDKTFSGNRDLSFSVVGASPDPVNSLPSPPTYSGTGNWTSSGGAWVWVWKVPPVNEPTPTEDLFVYSEDIAFSKDNPAFEEEITIFTNINYWASSTEYAAKDVAVNIYVTYPSLPKVKIGQTIIDNITMGQPDFGSRYISASWKNRAEGIYIVEVEIVPLDTGYVEETQLNNAATRAIIVGNLQPGKGAVSGQVTDPFGGYNGATINLINNNETIDSTNTDQMGHYLFPEVLVGDYQVEIETPIGYEVLNSEVKSTTVSSSFVSIVDFHLRITDSEGPITNDVLPDTNPTPVGGIFTLQAMVDDTDKGGSDIKSAGYSMDGGPSTSMVPGDGFFDSSVENVTYDLIAPAISGVYDICVFGTDEYDNDGPEECTLLVVYDPDGGFVTGGGWIDSPEGAYVPDASLIGKANFGFVSKYKKGETVPAGQTEFQFKIADLNFHSDTYDWLVIAGAKAMYKGTGTINGEGEYKFMLSAIDADINKNDAYEVDRFRIKIWYEANDTEYIVYDNALESDDDVDMTEIGGGSIVIHTKK